MDKNKVFIGIIAIVLLGVVLYMTNTVENKKVELETNHGKIVIELYSSQMPITTGNFEELVKKEFYDGVIFHRIIKGFMIQGGDPDGTGSGGPGYKIKALSVFLSWVMFFPKNPQ